MPEGDTVHKLAAALAAVLCGRAVDSALLEGRSAASLTGGKVEQVSASGKHLFIVFDSGLMLRSHLGMYGTWHAYAAGQPWRKPERQASIVLAADGKRFVCFNAREVELVGRDSLRRKDLMGRWGPDLVVAEDFRLLAARARALLSPATLLVDVLLDQRVASGVGNVYKSEVLFLEREPPVRRLGTLSDHGLANLYRCAAGLLRSNLGGGRRVTRCVHDGRGSLWVYKRRGRPCHVCGTGIVRGVMGRHLRVTYWCPHCQA